MEDLRITPAALRMQAEIARAADRPMLAGNSSAPPSWSMCRRIF